MAIRRLRVAVTASLCSGMQETGPVATWADDENAARWGAFPVDTVPRPIILLDDRVRIEGGFVDVASKIAWEDGAIDSTTPLPAGLSASLPPAIDGGGRALLSITDVSATAATFRCDRGPRELPAYRLKVTGMYGSCVILSPEVECWWPRLPADERRQPGGLAKIDDDGVTIHFPAFGGVLTQFHRAEFQEHTAYVVGRALTSERSVPKGTAVIALGISRMVTGRLTSPLNGRVLLDTRGQPLSVTPADESEQ
jgi:hypothetical protein